MKTFMLLTELTAGLTIALTGCGPSHNLASLEERQWPASDPAANPQPGDIIAFRKAFTFTENAISGGRPTALPEISTGSSSENKLICFLDGHTDLDDVTQLPRKLAVAARQPFEVIETILGSSTKIQVKAEPPFKFRGRFSCQVTRPDFSGYDHPTESEFAKGFVVIRSH